MSRINNRYLIIIFFPHFQSKGLKVVYNITHPPNNRVVSIDILHGDEYKPFELDKMYYVTASSFLNRNGGDGYIVIKNNRKNFM